MTDSSATSTAIQKQPPRFSNIECSRIFAMFLIVAHHLSVHGGVPIWQGDFPLTGNFYIAQMFSTGGKIGVNLFVLITGYFMCGRISKISSLVYLWLTTFLYVLGFFLIFSLFGVQQFSWSGLAACFFPIRNDFYWFVSAYFILVLISPFLSLSISALGEKKLLAFLLVFGVIWSVIPTLTTKSEYYSSTLLWFIYLYCMGSFLRLYLDKLTVSRWYAPLAAIGSWLLIALVVWLADINNRSDSFIGYIDWFTFANMTSIFSLIAAIGFFVWFKQWNLSYVPWINKIAASMLGVYLIHENPIVYPWLWKSVFNVKSHLESPYFFWYALAVTVLIFVLCTGIDLAREKFMRPWFNKNVSGYLKPYDNKIKDFFLN